MKTDKIVIVGGGSAGWMTAATLIKTFPDKDISVIESPDVPTVGVGEATQGQFKGWTKYIGLDENDFIPYTDATYKFSIQFTDFLKKDSGSYHYPFGIPHQEGEGDNPFTSWYAMRALIPELGPTSLVDLTFPAQKLWTKNKYYSNSDGRMGNFDPEQVAAYHFDATKFSQWLKNNYCLPRGVKYIPKHINRVDTDENGVYELVMKDNERITADLFIDCSGFRSLLLAGALAEPFTSYEDMLPNDSAWACQIPYKDKYAELQSYTNCTAIENGWCWNVPLWSRIGTGYNYSSKYVSDDEALVEFKRYLASDKMVVPRSPEEIETYTFRNIKTRIGIHERLFVKNVVAIGLSAGFIEPLESNGLFSVHEFLFLLIKIMGRGEINEFDRLWYNNEATDIFDGFAKFVAMHYAMTLRDDTPYWKDTMNRQYKEDYNSGYIDKTVRRANAFMGAQRKFFDIWDSHYTLNDGILYISAGMGYSPMLGRDLHHQIRQNPDLERHTLEVYDRWKKREEQWDSVSKEAPHMVNYMQKHFYNE